MFALCLSRSGVEWGEAASRDRSPVGPGEGGARLENGAAGEKRGAQASQKQSPRASQMCQVCLLQIKTLQRPRLDGKRLLMSGPTPLTPSQPQLPLQLSWEHRLLLVNRRDPLPPATIVPRPVLEAVARFCLFSQHYFSDAKAAPSQWEITWPLRMCTSLNAHLLNGDASCAGSGSLCTGEHPEVRQISVSSLTQFKSR